MEYVKDGILVGLTTVNNVKNPASLVKESTYSAMKKIVLWHSFLRNMPEMYFDWIQCCL